MGLILNTYERIYQGVLWVVSHFVDFSEPELLEGQNEIENIPYLLKSKGKKCVLVVTDEQIYKLGLTKALTDELEKARMPYALFHGVTANPSVTNVEDGLKLFKENGCDCLVAIGGGSSMDACKAIGARAVNPKKTVNKMKGLLKVRRRIPMMTAVPTTAGTGSETAIAAVIVDKETGDKYAINDPHLIPDYAVLDPTLLIGLPKHISATTGMDALTHAVEAFIGHSNTKKSRRYGLSAVKLIFQYLEKSVNEPTNIEYRQKMQLAAYQAGVAFTRAYVGTVHALAHSLGGKYNIPHGHVNAIILPKVLKAFGRKSEKKLALLADAVHIGEGTTKREKAALFIEEIEAMNRRMGIENTFGTRISDDDMAFLVNHAYKEGVPLYPTPRILSKKELTDIYKELQDGK